MMVIVGIYRIRPRRVAYRGDYCPHCKQARIFQATRSFAVAHFCFVPLIPLGFWKSWTCMTCGGSPTERTRRGFVMLVAVFLGLCAALETAAFITEPRSPDAPIFRAFALTLWAVASFLVFLFVRMGKVVSPEEMRARMVPLSKTSCALCRGALQVGPGEPSPTLWCPVCRVERME